MRYLKRIAQVSAIFLGCALHAQHLPLPASECTLSYRGYEEVLESFSMLRMRFGGCLDFSGDPAPDFLVNSASRIPCALELKHIHDRESKILFWVYKNSGELGFGEEAWNLLITEMLEDYPGQYTATFEKPFKEGKGSPILGYVPLRGTVSITEAKKGGNKYWFLLSLVPVKGSDKVLLVGLRTQDKHYAYMRAIYESFIKGLYFDDEVSLDP